MEAAALRRALETALDGEFEAHNYLGMSQIGKCPRYLYDFLVGGQQQKPSPVLRRFLHEGQLHEEDILNRLVVTECRMNVLERELVAPFDERFRGHVFLELDGDLAVIKSLSGFKHEEMRDHGAPFEHMDQCQMYMRYGGYERALILYKCRDNGELYVYEMHKSDRHGERLEQKAKMVLAAVDDRMPPACTCGRCGK